MTYKKTWISCLLWAVFTCITGVLLADYIISLWIQEIDASVGAGTVAFIAFVFALVVGACFLLRELYHKAENRHKADARSINIFENLVFLAVFAAGAYYRIDLCLHHSVGMITETPYFELAAVTAGKTSVTMIKSMADLYTVCLSFTLSFLGNKLIAGVWLQILLQMLTILTGFFAIRRMVGKVPAYAVLFFLSFSSVYTEQIFMMTPEVLSIFLFLLALLIIGSYVTNYSFDAYGVGKLILFTLLCGCMIGVLAYLDALFLTLLVIPAGLPWVICEEKEDIVPSKVLPLFLFVLVVSAAGLILMGLFMFKAYVLESSIAASAQSWIASYAHLPVYTPYVTGFSVIECFILAFGAAFLIISFWFRPKVQNTTPWIVFMLLFGPPHMMSDASGYRIYALFIWSVLAGIGLQQCFVPKKNTVSAVKTEPVEAQTTQNAASSEAEAATPPQMEPEVIAEMMPDKETKEQPIQEEAVKPRFIENPLPLPKKHEKRTLDYQYEVDDAKLEFDIEIAENDDFDV